MYKKLSLFIVFLFLLTEAVNAQSFKNADLPMNRRVDLPKTNCPLKVFRLKKDGTIY